MYWILLVTVLNVGTGRSTFYDAHHFDSEEDCINTRNYQRATYQYESFAHMRPAFECVAGAII